MNMITLTLKETQSIPLEADCITPDNLSTKTNDEIKRQIVYWGNRKKTLGDFFEVEGEKSDRITMVGDCQKVKLIGHKMSFGSILVKGNTGYNTGSYMTGGSLVIDGNTADYLGAMMEGGFIHLKGSAGHFTGGAYKGETTGMAGGEIVVEGSVGHEAGSYMRRGLIAIGGDAGDFTGLFLQAGSVVVLGKAGERAGANMKRGTIILMNQVGLLPSFHDSGIFTSPVINILMRRIKSLGLNPPETGRFARYTGDSTGVGKGEILIRVNQRNHITQ
ncbi:MAG: formylmethanofuran dehydrogenase subunit C [Nitrospinota bacterium]|nr:formylmethanofuran dehydrogenase subunit C [Nitrospinota bacterium]